MQINVLPPGSPSLFNAMLFPELNPQTQAWLDFQYQRDDSMLNDIGRSFLQTATQLYDRYIDPFLMQKARKLARSVKGMMHPNTIVPLETIEELQAAKPVMQRYIMAHVPLRSLYHQQRCDGYSDSYVDHEPGLVGEDHYDWRRVMDGHVQFVTRDDGTESWEVVMYPDDMVEGDRPLDVDEKFVLRDVYEIIDHALLLGVDPTDIFGGNL